MNWFRSKKKPLPQTTEPKSLPTEPVVYPVGVCVITDKSPYLINKDGKRYRIVSQRVLNSWNFPLVIPTTEPALRRYPVAVTKLPFRDGSLLNNIADGKLYLVSEGKLRHVVSPDVLDRFGLDHLMAVVVSEDEINIMKQGEAIY